MGQIGQGIDGYRLREVRAHPRHRLGDSLDARFLLADLRDARTDGAEQEANEDLVDDQGGEQLRVRWGGPSTRRGAPPRRRSPSSPGPRTRPGCLCGVGYAVREDFQRELRDLVRVEIELECEKRFALAGPDDWPATGRSTAYAIMREAS